jgi:HAD superfamily hydrolase (TIGR01509 family)
MTILPEIEAVLCDMDGLLLDSERLSMTALRLAAAELGTDLPEAFCHSMIGSPMDVCAALTRERAGPDFPVERYVALHESILARLVEADGMATRPGVAALLDMLDQRGLKRAVVTSSARARATHHLELAGILERFDLLVTRDDVSVGKPDPEPYLLAANRLGVEARACLALEDSHNGVRSAHAAGIRVIMVPDLLAPTPEMRDRAWHVMDDLHAVAALLKT